MRTYFAAWEQKAAGLEWRENLLARWLSGPRLLAAQVRADPTLASEEERAREFKARHYDGKLAELYSQALVGMVALTGRWWLEVRKPRREG